MNLNRAMLVPMNGLVRPSLLLLWLVGCRYMPVSDDTGTVDSGSTTHYRTTITTPDETTIDDALVAAREYSEQHGTVLIHPFDHADIVAGQATVGLEILKQIRNVATIVVPTGGGGLVAGIAAAVHFLAPQVRVIGVQAASAAAWPGSLAAGQPVRAETMSTMADGIAVAWPGAIPFAQVP